MIQDDQKINATNYVVKFPYLWFRCVVHLMDVTPSFESYRLLTVACYIKS